MIVNAKGNYRMEQTQSSARKETIRVPIKVCHDTVPEINSMRKETIRVPIKECHDTVPEISSMRKETIRVPIKVCHDTVPGVNSIGKETIRVLMDGILRERTSLPLKYRLRLDAYISLERPRPRRGRTLHPHREYYANQPATETVAVGCVYFTRTISSPSGYDATSPTRTSLPLKSVAVVCVYFNRAISSPSGWDTKSL